MQRSMLKPGSEHDFTDQAPRDPTMARVPVSRRLLAIAYHFPPIQGSSGVQRTLAFSRYLPEFGWNVTVLTVHRRAYRESRPENEALIPSGLRVIRAPAWDTVRHLALKGRYLRALALPDSWQSWIPGAVVAGLRAIRRERPAALFSTFPIASAHAIGLILARLSGLPWIADFRDPMYQTTYPPDPLIRRVHEQLERQVCQRANRILVTTRGTAEAYRRRYGEAATNRIVVVPNGFDPEVFPADMFDSSQAEPKPAGNRRLLLLHSGTLYPSERNPEPFLRALARLKAAGDPRYSKVQVVFRASGHDKQYRDLAAMLGVQDIVEFRPALPYRDALAEMLTADCLLIFQAANCNSQIPAKVYEALYVRRPIIGITDPAGDTGQLLSAMGVPMLARLEDEHEIIALLRHSIDLLRDGQFPLPSSGEVMMLSRRARTEELAKVLDEVSASCGICA